MTKQQHEVQTAYLHYLSESSFGRETHHVPCFASRLFLYNCAVREMSIKDTYEFAFQHNLWWMCWLWEQAFHIANHYDDREWYDAWREKIRGMAERCVLQAVQTYSSRLVTEIDPQAAQRLIQGKPDAQEIKNRAGSTHLHQLATHWVAMRSFIYVPGLLDEMLGVLEHLTRLLFVTADGDPQTLLPEKEWVEFFPFEDFLQLHHEMLTRYNVPLLNPERLK